MKSLQCLLDWDNGKPYQRCYTSIKISNDAPSTIGEVFIASLFNWMMYTSSWWEVISIRALSRLLAQLSVFVRSQGFFLDPQGVSSSTWSGFVSSKKKKKKERLHNYEHSDVPCDAGTDSADSTAIPAPTTR